MVEEEKFFAWLDGELPAEEAAQVERQVQADPELRRMAREHRAMAAGLRAAFDPVLQAPTPEQLRKAATATGESNIVDLASRRERVRPFATPARQWGAMAATLALGIVLGVALDSSGPVSPVEVREGELYAAGAVQQALELRLASAGAEADVRIGLTFRNQSGDICRSFESNAAAGLACKEAGDWRLHGLFPTPEAAETDYRMASGTDPRLMEILEAMMAGDPFDASQEAEARDRDWR